MLAVWVFALSPAASQASTVTLEYYTSVMMSGTDGVNPTVTHNLTDNPARPLDTQVIEDSITPFHGNAHAWIPDAASLYSESSIVADSASPNGVLYTLNDAGAFTNTANRFLSTGETLEVSFDWAYLVNPQGDGGYGSAWINVELKDLTDFSRPIQFTQEAFNYSTDGMAQDSGSFFQSVSTIAGHTYTFDLIIETEAEVFHPGAAASGYGYGEVTNLQIAVSSAVVPLPPALWLFASTLPAVVALGRRKLR
ncbi:hypothetical protein [Thiohalobacter sp.]|uniref:hypothetical protein n=1 Tax=Thiohalobacter sp. TaxID=2025948 RepID=UPI002637D702|nr:hypothetical protein [Thiohalobacter sp.]